MISNGPNLEARLVRSDANSKTEREPGFSAVKRGERCLCIRVASIDSFTGVPPGPRSVGQEPRLVQPTKAGFVSGPLRFMIDLRHAPAGNRVSAPAWVCGTRCPWCLSRD